MFYLVDKKIKVLIAGVAFLSSSIAVAAGPSKNLTDLFKDKDKKTAMIIMHNTKPSQDSEDDEDEYLASIPSGKKYFLTSLSNLNKKEESEPSVSTQLARSIIQSKSLFQTENQGELFGEDSFSSDDVSQIQSKLESAGKNPSLYIRGINGEIYSVFSHDMGSGSNPVTQCLSDLMDSGSDDEKALDAIERMKKYPDMYVIKKVNSFEEALKAQFQTSESASLTGAIQRDEETKIASPKAQSVQVRSSTTLPHSHHYVTAMSAMPMTQIENSRSNDSDLGKQAKFVSRSMRDFLFKSKGPSALVLTKKGNEVQVVAKTGEDEHLDLIGRRALQHEYEAIHTPLIDGISDKSKQADVSLESTIALLDQLQGRNGAAILTRDSMGQLNAYLSPSGLPVGTAKFITTFKTKNVSSDSHPSLTETKPNTGSAAY